MLHWLQQRDKRELRYLADSHYTSKQDGMMFALFIIA